MKEFGNSNAVRANLLCTNLNCKLNENDPKLMRVKEAVKLAQEHDEIEGHEGVVVYRDADHPPTSEVAVKVLAQTGVALF